MSRVRAVLVLLAVTVLITGCAAALGASPKPGFCTRHPNNPNCQTPPTSPPTSEPTTPPTTEPTDTTCTSPAVVPKGSAMTVDGPGGPYLVHNNNWNDTQNGQYTAYVCAYDDWWVIANVRRHSDGSVQAYPNIHKDYNDAALSAITSADFAGEGPNCDCIYNVAFDIWIGNGFDNELMIWTQNHNQVPAGTRLADTTIGGHTYQVWKSGGSNSAGGIFTYVATPVITSGTMPLALFFADLAQRGWILGPSTTWQVDFGVEIVDTNSTDQEFDFTNFEVR